MAQRNISSGRKVAPSRRSALRAALAGAAVLPLAACTDERLKMGSMARHLVEDVNHGLQGTLAGRSSMAQEFTQADVAAHFQSNGTLVPRDADYHALLAGGFKDWKLQVGGLVENPLAFTLPELREMPSRTQITRHDCVEGWSSIGKWKGVQLSHVLAMVRPLPKAKYVLFRCADSWEDPAPGRDSRYYESIGFDDAYHVQTLLAYELNDHALPVNNGAPLRLRVERQLGYKHAKYLMAIELVESFAKVGGGNGGFWEDAGYQWYAGI